MTRKRKKPLEQGEIVSLSWVDSAGTPGWTGNIIPVSLQVQTVGYLVADMEDRYIIASSMGPTGAAFHSPIHIPKVSVTYFSRLSEK